MLATSYFEMLISTCGNVFPRSEFKRGKDYEPGDKLIRWDRKAWEELDGSAVYLNWIFSLKENWPRHIWCEETPAEHTPKSWLRKKHGIDFPSDSNEQLQ